MASRSATGPRGCAGPGQTARSSRRRVTSIGTTASVWASIIDSTARADSTASPAPLTTATRTVALLAASWTGRIGGSPRCSSAWSRATRVPDPASRVTSGQSASSRIGSGPGAGQRVVGRRDQHQLVVADDPMVETPWGVRTLDETDIALPVQQPGDHLGGVADLGAHPQLRECPRRRAATQPGTRFSATVWLAARVSEPGPLTERLDPVGEPAGGGQQFAGPFDDEQALRGQGGARRRPADQREPEAAFEPGNGPADVRLRHPGGAGGRGQAAVIGNRHQRLDRGQIRPFRHIHRIWPG